MLALTSNGIRIYPFDVNVFAKYFLQQLSDDDSTETCATNFDWELLPKLIMQQEIKSYKWGKVEEVSIGKIA